MSGQDQYNRDGGSHGDRQRRTRLCRVPSDLTGSTARWIPSNRGDNGAIGRSLSSQHQHNERSLLEHQSSIYSQILSSSGSGQLTTDSRSSSLLQQQLLERQRRSTTTRTMNLYSSLFPPDPPAENRHGNSLLLLNDLRRQLLQPLPVDNTTATTIQPLSSLFMRSSSSIPSPILSSTVSERLWESSFSLTEQQFLNQHRDNNLPSLLFGREHQQSQQEVPAMMPAGDLFLRQLRLGNTDISSSLLASSQPVQGRIEPTFRPQLPLSPVAHVNAGLDLELSLIFERMFPLATVSSVSTRSGAPGTAGGVFAANQQAQERAALEILFPRQSSVRQDSESTSDLYTGFTDHLSNDVRAATIRDFAAAILRGENDSSSTMARSLPARRGTNDFDGGNQNANEGRFAAQSILLPIDQTKHDLRLLDNRRQPKNPGLRFISSLSSTTSAASISLPAADEEDSAKPSAARHRGRCYMQRQGQEQDSSETVEREPSDRLTLLQDNLATFAPKKTRNPVPAAKRLRSSNERMKKKLTNDTRIDTTTGARSSKTESTGAAAYSYNATDSHSESSNSINNETVIKEGFSNMDALVKHDQSLSASKKRKLSKQSALLNPKMPEPFTLTNRPPISLAIDGDEAVLSPYQCYLRKQIEVFETNAEHLEGKAQGRNTPIVAGQVGIQCKYCGRKPISERTSGSIFYSQALGGLYQIAQNMCKTHFLSNCPNIPTHCRDKLALLQQNLNRGSGGKEYWKEAASKIGIIEDDMILKFTPSIVHSALSSPSSSSK